MSTYKPKRSSKIPYRLSILFLCVVIGMMSHWFWRTGWRYIANPSVPLAVGTLQEVTVRLILYVCAATTVFVPLYQKLQASQSDAWTVYFVAFQFGFSWHAAFSETNF